MTSLKREIINKIRSEYPNWVHKGTIERLAMELGFDAENGARRARELVKSGIIERRINEKHCVEYRFIFMESTASTHHITEESTQNREQQLLDLATQ